MFSSLKITLSDTIDQAVEQFVTFLLWNLIILNRLLAISKAPRISRVVNFETTKVKYLKEIN
jgi:hypothetical protein